MKPAPGQLEVVAGHEQGAGDDERRQQRRHLDRAEHADRDRAHESAGRECDQRPAAQAGPERPAVELVERVCADPDGEKERAERGRQTVGVHDRRGRRAQGDVAQVPGRVRRVEQRDEVPPAPGTQRIEGGARGEHCENVRSARAE